MTFTRRFLSTISIIAMGAALTACSSDGAMTKSDEMAEMSKDTKMEKMDVSSANLEEHLYLEEVLGEEALAQVNEWNAASAAKMETPLYEELSAELLEVYNSPDKIPYVSFRNGWMHNFWQDENNVKGVWRRTSKFSYLSDEPSWDTVLDIDALAKSEGKNWVYKGNNCLGPNYRYCMVSLSDGGKDATELREFDTVTKQFVDGGFFLPESKGGAAWLDADHLVIGRDFGDGTMTESGYPMVSKLWTRGTDMSSARELMRGEPADVGVWSGTVDNADGTSEIVVTRATTFYTTEYYWIPQEASEGMWEAFEPVKVPVPEKVELSGQFGDQILVRLQEEWRGFKSGALVSFSLEDFKANGEISAVNEIITPSARQSIGNFGVTKDAVLLSLYDNVAGSAHAFTFDGGTWSRNKLDFPENGSVSIGSTNDKESVAFISTEGFLQPDTLWMIDTSSMEITEAKSMPSWFDSEDMVVEQFMATSTDGTKVPYFVVRMEEIDYDGKNPTLLYGYGGFEIALNPSYSSTIGKAWLERGGVYVLANIRGGGEFGPDWHQAGLKTKRQVIYDDFIAVAEDLIDKDITSPEHLGIHGRSNGGLLMGVMFTQRPDLFNAVTIGVPLLDMQRYHLLLAGASWVGEYGDPDDKGAEGEFIRTLSPYHQLKDGVDYPVPYIYTSTKDDRVHPGHARKFAARLEDLDQPFFYYENIDGGHAGAANLKETAHSQALIYSYLWSQLGGEE